MNSQNGNNNMNTNMNNGINNSKVNGRVDILNPPDIAQLFSMYDKIPANQCTTFRNATIGQWDETPLSISYFLKRIFKSFRMEYALVFTICQMVNM